MRRNVMHLLAALVVVLLGTGGLAAEEQKGSQGTRKASVKSILFDELVKPVKALVSRVGSKNKLVGVVSASVRADCVVSCDADMNVCVSACDDDDPNCANDCLEAGRQCRSGCADYGGGCGWAFVPAEGIFGPPGYFYYTCR
ncbi:MAG: hypothetical protein F4Y16_00190 [Holophagales bacterium]|nr:hypothetical protein [Holophagales bacterium]MYH26046.1 hypothetical protein [Holophagales bacterium]